MNEKKRKVAIRVAFICVIAIFLYLFFYFLPDFKARKTYISSLLDGNVNVNSVREMAGHRDERTTLSNYYFDRSSDEEKKKMIEAALAI